MQSSFLTWWTKFPKVKWTPVFLSISRRHLPNFFVPLHHFLHSVKGGGKDPFIIFPQGEDFGVLPTSKRDSMRAISETAGRRQVEIHYVNGGTPGVVEENFDFEAYFLEHTDLSLEEVLQDQEIVYQSLQTNGAGNRAKASGSSSPILNHDQSSGLLEGSDQQGKDLQVNSAKSHLELDEELAISLQELENQLGSVSFHGTSGTEAATAVNREVEVTETSSETVTEDNVDPDNMTYEELQSLGESIGSESKGLTDELISYLRSYKYKTGFFKKEKHEECVICYMAYKNRDRLTTLPCKHEYHSECVTKWLKINKACPVCNEEVFGS